MKSIKKKFHQYIVKQKKVAKAFEYEFCIGKIINSIQMTTIAIKPYDLKFPSNWPVSFNNTLCNIFTLEYFDNQFIYFCLILLPSLMIILNALIALTNFYRIYSFCLYISTGYIINHCLLLIIPIQYQLMRIYQCDGFAQCFNGNHMLWLVFGLLAQLTTLITAFLGSLIINDTNPNSSCMFASCDGFLNIAKLSLQLIIGIGLGLKLRYDVSDHFSIFICVSSLIVFTMRFK